MINDLAFNSSKLKYNKYWVENGVVLLYAFSYVIDFPPHLKDEWFIHIVQHMWANSFHYFGQFYKFSIDLENN